MPDIKFNEWDHSPINLSPEEIAKPLLVLDDFFSSDWLPGQYDDLLRWRKFILADESFVDSKGHASSLLQSYKLNVKLMDACYLILEGFKNSNGVFGAVIAKDADQVAYERESWRDFPNLLREDLVLNPIIILEQFFEAFSLPIFRSLLYEWLEAGLSKNAIGEFMEASDIFAVYENLQNLYGAAWLIYQRLTDDPYLKVDKDKSDAPAVILEHAIANPSIYKLDNVITASQHEPITQIVAIIKERLPSVQAIIYLGVPATNAACMFLLVLTDNKEQGLAQDISNHLEECCKKVANAVILVHHAASMIIASDEKNLFLKKAANCPVIYLAGGLIFPKQKGTDHLLVNEVALQKWQRWHSQSQEFLKGAEYYSTIGAHNALLFSLSQIAECLLVAIIRLITGYDMNTHNLERLLKLTLMFTGDISAVFELDNEESKKLFNVLKGAYVDVRYRDRYEVDPPSVSALYLLVKKMIVVVDEVNQKHLLTSTL